eukprot:scaffold3032_cov375-Prasinococcus_capsulatus_cf.AAC.4
MPRTVFYQCIEAAPTLMGVPLTHASEDRKVVVACSDTQALQVKAVQGPRLPQGEYVGSRRTI